MSRQTTPENTDRNTDNDDTRGEADSENKCKEASKLASDTSTASVRASTHGRQGSSAALSAESGDGGLWGRLGWCAAHHLRAVHLQVGARAGADVERRHHGRARALRVCVHRQTGGGAIGEAV